MAMNSSKLLSGRVPVTAPNAVSNSRYEFLGLSDAEPSLGVPVTSGSVFTSTSNGDRSWSNAISINSNVVTFYSKYSFPQYDGVWGQVLYTDGNGQLGFATIPAGRQLINGTSNVVVRLNSDISMSVDSVANVVVVSTNNVAINANLSVTGNISNANIVTANTVNANLVNANYLVSNSGCVKIAQAVIAVDGNNAGIFASLVDDVNIGLMSNVVMGSPTGNITSQGTFNAPNISVTGTIAAQNVKVGDLYSNRAPVNVTINTIIDSFNINEYRSAKYTIRASNDLGYQALEVLLVHDNINSITTVYGSLSTTGSDIITLDSDINTGIVELRATGLGANTQVNLLGTYVPD